MPRTPWARRALAALGALVAWSFVSVLWARAPGPAWEESNLLLVTLLAGWVLALLPWSPRRAEITIAAWSAGVAIVAAVTVISALNAADLSGYFSELRWASPVGYPNGNAALGVMGALPALVLASRPRMPALAQGGLLAVATFLAGFALLPQSRGAIIGAVAALLVALVMVRHRWSLVLRLGVVVAAGAIAIRKVLDVYDTTAETLVASTPLEEAAQAMALSAAVAGVVGVALAIAQSRVRLGEGGERAARWGGLAVAAAVLIGVGAVGVAHAESISDEVSSQWRQLVSPTPETAEEEYRRNIARGESERGRLLDPSPYERYDYVRVAWRAFKDAPVGGVGAGGFALRYTEDRNYPKSSKYPHSIVLRALSEGGIVGLALLLAFVAVAVLGLALRLREASPEARTVAAAALASTTYFAVHGQFDWLEQFPVMAGPAAGFLLVALVVRERPRSEDPPRRLPLPIRMALPYAGATAAMVVVFSVGFPYLAQRYVERAQKTWRTDPEAAAEDLKRARSLNPFSVSPRLVEGTIALERRDADGARAAFNGALARQPHWLAHLELALLEDSQGDTRAAMRQLALARELNPREALIPAAEREIRAAGRVDPAAFNRQLFELPLFKVRKLT